VVRRDSFRTVIRTLFVLQGRGAERSMTWTRGRKAEWRGCYCRNPRYQARRERTVQQAVLRDGGLMLQFGQWSCCSWLC
jgi:hypothetical protein